MKSPVQILMWLMQVVLLLPVLLLLLFWGWFIFGLVADGISSKALALDAATPVEGWSAWRRTQWLNAAPELLLMEGAVGGLVWWLSVLLCRLFRRLFKSG